jgi:hypothetical protein
MVSCDTASPFYSHLSAHLPAGLQLTGSHPAQKHHDTSSRITLSHRFPITSLSLPNSPLERSPWRSSTMLTFALTLMPRCHHEPLHRILDATLA